MTIWNILALLSVALNITFLVAHFANRAQYNRVVAQLRKREEFLENLRRFIGESFK